MVWNSICPTGVTKSDHDSVLLATSANPQSPRRQMKQIWRRNSDRIRTALVCYHIQHFNWTPLFYLDNCAAMVDYFYTVILSLLDYYLPVTKITRCSTDKPWVTPSFRVVIRRRQKVFLTGNFMEYHCLRNRCQRTAAKLLKNYFTVKVHHATHASG